jgi:hypothetical protein
MSFISYADTNTSTSDEDAFRWLGHNIGEVSDKDAFEETYNALMSRLTARVVNGSAASSSLAPMFATGEAVYDSAARNGTMYGLLQCMRDRTAEECDQCLRDSIGQLPVCCYGNQGGVVLGYNCYLRMEIYPYFDLALDASPPLAAPPSIFAGERPGELLNVFTSTIFIGYDMISTQFIYQSTKINFNEKISHGMLWKS